MKLAQVAQKYQRQIKAQLAIYPKLVELHELAEALAFNPYEDLSPEAMTAGQDIAHKFGVLLDRAWRQGLSASELKFSVDKIKSKILQYATDPKLQQLGKELEIILSKLQNLPLGEVAAQQPVTPEPVSDPEESTYLPAGINEAIKKLEETPFDFGDDIDLGNLVSRR